MDFSKGPNFRETFNYGQCPDVDYGAPIENSPITRGFDYFYGISASLDMPPYIYIENDRFTALPDHITKGTGMGFFREGPTAPDFVHEEVLDHLTDKAMEVIETYQNDPFFLYFPLPAPHTPILPAPKFCGKSKTNAYGDFVLHCDDVVGRIRRKLQELGPGSGGWSDPKPGCEPDGCPRFQLYDLEQDIGERTNIIRQHPDLARRMRSILREYVRRGRSTPGADQKNTGRTIWPAVDWLNEKEE